MMYKYLIITTFNVLIYITCAVIIGLFLPIVISLIACLADGVKLSDCVGSSVFWVFSILFTISALFYLNEANEDKQIQKP